MMRYISINQPGPQSYLSINKQEPLHCEKEQLLVRVRATALNRADLLQRQGKYPPPPGESTIPGLEIAGEVTAIGSKVKNFKVGDRIYGLVGSGGYADYCCIHQSLAAHLPDDWDFSYAAALPEALTTAHATIFLSGELKKNQTLLIHAAGSGISSLAIQMAKQIGATVITTVSNPEKMLKATQLGATRVINYKTEDFASVLAEQSIDLIVDFIGGSYFSKHLNLLKPQGKLIQIACMQGHLVECDLVKLMRKRLEVKGFILRSQTLAEKAYLWQSAQQQWSASLLNKEITPIIDSEFHFEDITNAHLHMQNNTHFGKIVVKIS